MPYNKIVPPKYNETNAVLNSYFYFDQAIISTLDFALEDLTDLYNLSIEPIIKKDEFLTEQARKHPIPMDIETDEDYRLMRINQGISEQGSKINSMASFLNQVTAIYLWVIVEQTENKLINLIENTLQGNDKHNGFTDWKRRKKYFKALNVKVEGFKAYFDVLELQKFNNKAKHLGKVDKELANIKTFKGKENIPLEHVTVPIEKYLNQSYYYILELFNQVAKEIFPKKNEL
ncbi:hypothetical protein G5B37_03660 [Rasiella rasia]|uniref:Cthe-2314-like HEPN domain-containing protein n=1 Tax=Rasiella rasia TaxID=2744027 RepID=A0A6G6GJH1_9FLAO|nr:hypothetical protein [Rasiella rasia]QIE58688.1 hypothetical protein G5B37_03660 [Rasiella rasia]